VQVSNHLKLLWTKAMVVSVEEKAYRIGQVWITKVSGKRTNGRIEIFELVSKLGSCPYSKRSRGATCLLPRWHPVFSWHERDPGSGVERGNSACDVKRKLYKCDPRKGKVSRHRQGAEHPVVVRKGV
jgi:hypothetical protein